MAAVELAVCAVLVTSLSAIAGEKKRASEKFPSVEIRGGTCVRVVVALPAIAGGVSKITNDRLRGNINNCGTPISRAIVSLT